MVLKIFKLWKCSPKEREKLLKRSELKIASVIPRVRKLVEDVRKRGDQALIEYTQRFDGVKLSQQKLRVSKAEIQGARGKIGEEVVTALEQAASAIRKFHEKLMPQDWVEELSPGVKVGQIFRPLSSVGVYVPGGLASYPSSLLMMVIPARVAGVEKIVVCTPPGKDGKIGPATLVAADLAEVDVLFRVGGAQAIAAMAYGTQTIPRVDKIVGPGNIYVTAAKQIVSTEVSVDFPAGPSEVLILADGSANPRFVAADLIAQAEHDPAATAVLVTISESLASKVRELVRSMLEESPRKDIVVKALGKQGRIVIARSLKEAIDFANDFAPEHLQLMLKQPLKVLGFVRNAGAVFIGPHAPVAVGDYAVGPSHVLPTGGAARGCSGLSLTDFLKSISVQALSERGFKRVAKSASKLAEVEGLMAHAKSIRERFKEQ